MVLRFHGIAVDPSQIAHQLGGIPVKIPEMIRTARQFGLKTRVISTNWRRLPRIALPAIAERHDGSFFVIAKIGQEDALIHDPIAGRPQIIARPEFEAAWTGNLVLMARRAAVADLARKFDIGWFLQALHKYRRLLGEVLVASFFLQICALITPLFFQVVIDKVLVRDRGCICLRRARCVGGPDR
jgi:subfamily B ATP-binding cassette protein HlyB/CyaB